MPRKRKFARADAIHICCYDVKLISSQQIFISNLNINNIEVTDVSANGDGVSFPCKAPNMTSRRFSVGQKKLNLDCGYTFPIDSSPNGIPFGAQIKH